MRKRRTREHVIADISLNHLEHFVLRAGHVVHRTTFDYGYDLYLYTFNDQGEVEPGYAALQLKATDTPHYLQDHEYLTITIQRRELEQWLEEPLPVFLVVYDAPAAVAYWAHVQDQFWNRITEVAGDTVTLRLNIEKQIDTLAIHQMRRTIRTWVRRSEVDHGSN